MHGLTHGKERCEDDSDALILGFWNTGDPLNNKGASGPGAAERNV